MTSTQNSSFDFDLFVIGGGSGGVRASRIAAQHGARVAIAEEYRYGGTCVIRGCIPKKLFVYASEIVAEIQDARGFGWTIAAPSFDWKKLRAAKDKEIARLNGIYIDLLKKNNVTAFHDRATFVDAHTLQVGEETIRSKTILIAVGGHPFLPDIPGSDHAKTSNEMFLLDELPAHIAIVGGGYIAVEFAGILRGFGCEVTQFYRGNKVLRGFDEDVRAHVQAGLRHRGVDLRLKTNVTAIAKTKDGVRLSLTDKTVLDAGLVLYATGREPSTKALGLDKIGVETAKNGAILVDELSQTNVANVYAVGDCTPRSQLTPVAIRDGHAFADTVFGNRPTKVDHAFVPSAIFSQPPAAVVGLTEAQAREQADIDVYRSTFRPLKHTLSGRDEKVMMKLLVNKEDQRVIGAHMVGAGSPEIIQVLAVAMKMGATKNDLDATVALHPTTAEEFVLMRTPEC